MSSDPLGLARKSRGIFEDPSWTESLGKANVPVEVWDMRFLWAIEQNISFQPLENTDPFLEHPYRILQVSMPNAWVGWVYFRIEPDDENCTLLWLEVRRIRRIG